MDRAVTPALCYPLCFTLYSRVPEGMNTIAATSAVMWRLSPHYGATSREGRPKPFTIIVVVVGRYLGRDTFDNKFGSSAAFKQVIMNRQCLATEKVANPDEPAFEIIDSPIPSPGPGDVLLRVLACGVCHSDSFSVEGTFNNSYPIAPGHEVIGKVMEAGTDASAQKFEKGAVVGIGWHGNHCQSCEACSDGDFICCDTKQITGIHFGGGYQQYMLAPVKTLARVPEGMDPITAAPLLCAGVTVFNALRGTNEKAKQPAIVAVVGVGGLGNLAIQYASKFGYTVVAISRGSDKKQHALELGAAHYIDSKAENVGQALQSLGGAKIVLSTAPSAAAAGACIDGLSRNGKLVVLGATKDQIPVTPLQLIGKRRTIVGWPAGTARDSQDAMEFAHFHKISSKTVVFEGIDKAPEAYAAMRQGVYRVVIKVAGE